MLSSSDRSRARFFTAALLLSGAPGLFGSGAHADGFHIGAGAGFDFS